MAKQDPQGDDYETGHRADDLKANGARGDRQGVGFQDAIDSIDGQQPGAGLRDAESGVSSPSGDKETMTPEQMGQAEDAPEGGFYKGWGNKADGEPKWYKRAAVEGGKAALGASTGKLRKAVMITVVVNLFAIAMLLLLATLGPWKHIHFETVMRAVNFARFQTIIHGYASKIVFEAAVLTDDSDGTFRRSPLVRQILLATPDRQVKQLGRSDKLKFEFYPNHSFGSGVLPLSESLRAVVIDGHRISLDDVAQRELGVDYKDISSRRDRWRVETAFVREVKFQLGDIMELMPRHVRWNPMYQLRQRVGIHLVKWLNNAKDYHGKTPQESKAQNVDDTVDRVMGPEENLPRSVDDGINEEADEEREHRLEAIKTGQGSPGEVRSRIANRMKTIGTFSDVAFVATATCIVHDLANSFKEYQDEREAMAMRSGADKMISTDQIKSGPVTGEAVGAANSFWDASGDIPPAHMSVGYREVTNQRQLTDPAEIDRQMNMTPWLKPVDAFSQAIIVADQFLNYGLISLINEDLNQWITDHTCDIVLEEVTQYSIAAIEGIITVLSLGSVKGAFAATKAVVSIGTHALIGYGLNELLGMLIQKSVAAYSGLDFAGVTQGADRFNTGMVEVGSLSQGSNRMTYGGIMTQGESQQATTLALNEMRAENRKKPFGERYFALDNPFSLLGMVVARIPSSAGGMANTVHSGASFLGSILTSPFRLVGSIADGSMLFKPAYAADTSFLGTSFGVEQWGWTVAELERIDNDDTFSLRPLIQRVEPQLERLNGLYADCYNFTTYALQSEKPEKCTKEYLASDDALYWRYYNAMKFTAEVMTGDL